MATEEDMKKHFNILDWEEVERNEKYERLERIGAQQKTEKTPLDENDLAKITEEFRQKIVDYGQKKKPELSKKNDDDYDIPEEVANFERTVDLRQQFNSDKYTTFNQEIEPIIKEVMRISYLRLTT